MENLSLCVAATTACCSVRKTIQMATQHTQRKFSTKGVIVTVY